MIQYHELLWSKPLPDITPVEAAQAGKPGGVHLRFATPSRLFLLTSGSITDRYTFASVVQQIPAPRLCRPMAGTRLPARLQDLVPDGR